MRRNNGCIGFIFVVFLVVVGLIALIKSCANGDITFPSGNSNYSPISTPSSVNYEDYFPNSTPLPEPVNCFEDKSTTSKPSSEKSEDHFSNSTSLPEPVNCFEDKFTTSKPSMVNGNNGFDKYQSFPSSNTISDKNCECCLGIGRYLGVVADEKFDGKGFYYYCGLCKQRFLYIKIGDNGEATYLHENKIKHDHPCPCCHGTGKSIN